MADLDRNDREIVDGITQISGATSNPTTAGDDVIDLFFVNFLLPGTTAGLIDGQGGTDRLRVNSVNLSGVDIEGIEETEFSGFSQVTVDATELGDLGTLIVTNTQPGSTNDGFLRLDYSDAGSAITLDLSGFVSLGDDLVFQIGQTGQFAGQEVTADFSGVVRGTVDTRFVYTGGAADETITGTAGDDSLDGNAGENSITGGAGDDTLRASGGISTLDGGLGDDSLLGSSLSGLILGGAGNDTITQSTGFFVSGAYVPVEVSGGDDDDDITVSSIQGDGSTVRGDAGNDTVTLNNATLRDGIIDGGTGTNILEFNGSNLSGSTISNFAATTILSGSTVVLDGSQFANLGTVIFTNSVATVGSTGLDGRIQLNFADGLDTTVDVAGTTAIGDQLRVEFRGIGQVADQDITIDFSSIARGTLNSVLTYLGGVADETITGTAGADSILGSSGDNSIAGGAGDDTLRSGSGVSTLDGGLGDDSLIGSGMSGVIFGGDGNDTISQSSGRFESGAYVPVEVSGGDGDDDITVASVQGFGSTLRGDAGNDTILLGNATLRDGVIDGGTGTNVLGLIGGNLSGSTISNFAATTILNSSAVVVDGSQFGNLGTVTFTDTLATIGSIGIDSRVQLNFADGLDTTVDVSGITGIGDELRVEFRGIGQVADQGITIDFSSIARGTENSLLTYIGGLADETITGTAGADSILGSSGDNSIAGGAGDDTLRSDAGVSTLDGGLGNDSLIGSGMSGIISGGEGNDTITQSSGRFENGAYIPVEISGGDGDDDITVASVQGAGSTVRGDAGDDTITFNSVNLQDGIVDGGTGTNLLELSSTNLAGSTISNFAATTILGTGGVVVDGSQFANLGTVTFTDSSATVGSTATDANIQLNFADGLDTTVDVSGTTAIGDELRVVFRQIGQVNDQQVTIDFSSIARGTENSLLSYFGGVADETITGTAGADSIDGATGDNFIAGGAGDDTLRATTGESTLDGGLGDDSLIGAGMSGEISGGAGNDTITQSTGLFQNGAYLPVEISGGDNDDDISVTSIQGDGSTVRGDAGNDTVTVTNATFRDGIIDGGAGTDQLELTSTNLRGTDIEGIESTTILSGGTITIGADQVADLGALTVAETQAPPTSFDGRFSLAVDSTQTADFSGLTLGDGTNLIITTLNTDTTTSTNEDPYDLTIDLSGITRTGTQVIDANITGVEIRGTIIASSGVDNMAGGSRTDDTLSYQASDAGVTVDIDAGTASGGWAEGDIIAGFENLIGSESGDVLTGRDAAFGSDTRGDNEITGLGGDDTITTGTGEDTIVATVDNGDDTITDFENGSDRVDLRDLPRDAAIVAFLTASDDGAGNTVLTFASGGSMVLVGLDFADYDISDVILEDGVYALDEAFTLDEDSTLVENVLAANAPFGFTDIEIDNQVSLGSNNLEVIDFTVDGVTYTVGTTATLDSGATLTVESDGSFTYDGTNAVDIQALNGLLAQSAVESFTYTVISTATGSTDEGEVEITVTGVNDAPVIGDEAIGAVTEDGANLVLDLLSVASDVDDQDVLTVVNLGALPAGVTFDGTRLTVDADSPAFQELSLGETREITVPYDVEDTSGSITSGGLARITITGTNDVPTITGTTAAATEDGPTVDVDLTALADDIDSEDDPTTLTYEATDPPEGSGSVSVTDGVLTFDPGSDFQDLAEGETRDVSIPVRVVDAQGAASDFVDVVVTITGTNDAPTFVALVDTINVVENTTAVTTLQGADVDSSDTLTFSISGGADAALFTVDETTGELTFIGAPDFETPGSADGDNSYDVQVSVSDGTETTTRDLTVNVTDVNEAAAALVSISAPADAPEGDSGTQTIIFTVSRTGDTSQAVTVSLSQAGTADGADVTGVPGSVTIPAGADSVTFTVDVTGDTLVEPDETLIVEITALDRADHDIASGSATYVIENDDIANSDPVAVTDPISTDEDNSVAVDLLGNDTDVDNDALIVTEVRDEDGTVIPFDTPTELAGGGTLTITADGTGTFDPGGAFEGLTTGDSSPTFVLTYDISDGNGGTDTGTFTLDVTGVNDAPVAVDDQTTTPFETLVAVDVTANDTDVDGGRPDLVGANVVTPGAGMAVVVDGQVQFTPAPGFSGEVEITYDILDADGGSDSGTLTVTVGTPTANVPPVAGDDGGAAFTTNENTGFTTGDVTANDNDADGGTLTVSGVDTTGTLGLVTDNGDGTFDYDPNGQFEFLGSGETATDTFEYTISDGQGGSDTATVTVTITGVNDAPVAGESTGTTAEDTAVVFDITSLVSDVEGDALSIENISVTAGATVVATAVLGFQLTPDDDFFGTVTVTYTVTDGDLVSETAEIEFTITPENDAPVILSGDSFSVDENTTLVGTIAATDVDPDDTLTYTITGGADAALFEIDAMGALSFINAPDFETPLDAGGVNSYDVEISVSDGIVTTTQDVSVTVTDVNEDAGGVITDVAGQADLVIGTNAAETIRILGGRVDRVFAGGGLDTYDLGALQTNGSRDVLRLEDYEAGEVIAGIALSDIIRVDVVDGDTLRLRVGPDRDVILVSGVTDLSELTFDRDVFTDFANQGDDLTGTEEADEFIFLGGVTDTATGLGGIDSFDVSALQANGTADRLEITDYEAGERLVGLSEDEVTSITVNADGDLELALAQDGDVIVLSGIEDAAQINFDGGTQISDRPLVGDFLEGTEGADAFQIFGGGFDRISGLGGVDSFDLTAIQLNGERDVVRILDFEAGEVLLGISAADVQVLGSSDENNLRLRVGPDRDVIVLTGISDLSEVTFGDDLPIA